MKNQESINKLIAYSEKPMSGFCVIDNKNELILRMKPKTILFGCLTIFFIGLSSFLFFYMKTNPARYIITLFPIFIGFMSLINLSKNATKTTFNFIYDTITYENSNFIGKIFNKPIKIDAHSIFSIDAHEEKIKNNSSSNGTTSYNYVYKVYLNTKTDKYQLITVNKGVLSKDEVDDLAVQLKTILNLN